MRIVCCPDSLKGVLAASEAAAALAAGVRRVTGCDADEIPLADGGEGTAEALFRVLGGEWRTAVVADALGRPVEARYLMLPGGRAIVESAEAIGLWRLGRQERNPMRTTSLGLGQLLIDAVDAGAQEVIVTLGGSATVDGGAGLRQALAGGRLDAVRLRAACDVTNPLLGPRGAARVFGPQKGATAQQVEELERCLAALDELRPYAELPGAGAAGGLGAALAALGATLEPGSRLVLEAVGFRARLAGASLAVTGEGSVDDTSASGKVPGAVASACREVGVSCVVFGGRVDGGVAALRALGASDVVALSGKRSRARQDLRELGERLAAHARQGLATS